MRKTLSLKKDHFPQYIRLLTLCNICDRLLENWALRSTRNRWENINLIPENA